MNTRKLLAVFLIISILIASVDGGWIRKQLKKLKKSKTVRKIKDTVKAAVVGHVATKAAAG